MVAELRAHLSRACDLIFTISDRGVKTTVKQNLLNRDLKQRQPMTKNFKLIPDNNCCTVKNYFLSKIALFGSIL